MRRLYVNGFLLCITIRLIYSYVLIILLSIYIEHG